MSVPGTNHFAQFLKTEAWRVSWGCFYFTLGMMKKNSTDLRVLVVDDEPLIRHVISKFLAENNVLAKAVATAEDALNEIRVQHYDLCFLDVIMPGMTGLEAMKIINELSPGTKVAIMTGTFFDKETIEQIEELSYAFIEKPFSLSQISRVVDRVTAALPERQMVRSITESKSQ